MEMRWHKMRWAASQGSLVSHESGIVPDHPMFVQRSGTAPGVEPARGLLTRIDVHTDTLCFLLHEPCSDSRNKLVSDPLTSFVCSNIDPLQFSIAIESTCSVSRGEAHDVSFVDGNKDRAFRQRLLGKVLTVLISSDSIFPECLVPPLLGANLCHLRNVMVFSRSDRYGHRSPFRS